MGCPVRAIAPVLPPDVIYIYKIGTIPFLAAGADVAKSMQIKKKKINGTLETNIMMMIERIVV